MWNKGPPQPPHPHLNAIKRRAMDQRPAAAPRQVDTGPLCLPPPASIQKHIETNKYTSIQIRKYIFIQIRKYTFIQKHKSTTVSIQQHKYAITKTQINFHLLETRHILSFWSISYHFLPFYFNNCDLWVLFMGCCWWESSIQSGAAEADVNIA